MPSYIQNWVRGKRGGGGGFDPKRIAGLSAWYDFSDVSTLFQASNGTTAVAADGDPIGYIKDKSGNGNHLSQAVNNANRPTYKIVGGRGLGRFDGSNDSLFSGTHTVTAQAPLTVYTVASADATNPAGTSRIAAFQAAGGVGWAYGLKNPLGAAAFVTWGVKGYDPDPPVFVATVPVISGIRLNADFSADEFVNGTFREKVTHNANAGAGAVNFRVGSSADATELWDGDIYAVLVYSGAHTQAQIDQITSYLAIRYGVSVNKVSNAATFQTTPTYDSSGQAAHPGLYYNAAGWNNFKYWMAMTPFPGGDASKENPSILQSNDGDTWTVPAGLTNPIDAKPGTAYNSDADILVDGTGTMWCVYRETDGSTYDKLKVRSSADGVTWGAEAEILSGTFSALLSPSVIWDGSQFVMWTITRVAGYPYQHVERRTCATMTGTWSAGADCTFANKPNQSFGMWHVCVRLSGTTYQMLLLSESLSGYTLSYLTSVNGTAWTFDTRFQLYGASGAWDGGQMYRGSFVDMTTYLDIWYSAKDANTVWHIGRTRFIK